MPSSFIVAQVSTVFKVVLFLQDIENVHKGKSDCTPQLLPEPLQIAQSFEESKEEAGALVLHGLVDNTMHDTEV